jgi:chromosome segregation ATPase
MEVSPMAMNKEEQTRFDNLSAQVADLTKENESLSAQVADLTKENESLQNHLQALNDDFNSATAHIRNLEAGTVDSVKGKTVARPHGFHDDTGHHFWAPSETPLSPEEVDLLESRGVELVDIV